MICYVSDHSSCGCGWCPTSCGRSSSGAQCFEKLADMVHGYGWNNLQTKHTNTHMQTNTLVLQIMSKVGGGAGVLGRASLVLYFTNLDFVKLDFV